MDRRMQNRVAGREVASRWITTTVGLGVVAACCVGTMAAAAGRSLEALGNEIDGELSGARAPIAVESRADELGYDNKTGWISGRGNVVISRGSIVLKADRIRVNVNSGEAYAEGGVSLKRGEDLWTGDKLHYNFRTGEGDVGAMALKASPFHIAAEKTKRGQEGTFVTHGVRLTTCARPDDHWHYHVSCRKLILDPDDYIKGYGAVWRFGRVPVFYLPYIYRNLEGEFGLRFRPGYNSRMGAMLLSSYRYRLNPSLKAETHLDYRTKRGVGIGQDFTWQDPARDQWQGLLKLYYADDQAPVDDDDDPLADDLSNERYRILLRHRHTLSPRDYVLAQLNYLSDTDVLEDFFEREHRAASQPENYISYGHRGDNYQAGVILQGRVNDFYSNINRLPEATLDFNRQTIAESDFFYESRTAVSGLAQVWEATSDLADYDVNRFDTWHTVNRPDKHFGFLNLIPRLSYRGTYYSKTIEQEDYEVTDTNGVSNMFVDENGVLMATRTEEAGAAFRNVVQFGIESSFKAFKVWDGRDGLRRHIVEPYVDYVLQPEPNVTADELYQFDRVDEIEERHGMLFGLRNRIQGRNEERGYRIWDLDLYTWANFNPDTGEESFDQFSFDTDIFPHRYWLIEMDGIYGATVGEFEEFNARARFIRHRTWGGDLEYRYRLDDSSLVIGEVNLHPGDKWVFDVYGRYEVEESRLEETAGYIRRNLDCIAMRVGLGFIPSYETSEGITEDDEWRFMFEMWLTAFPELGAKSGSYRKY